MTNSGNRIPDLLMLTEEADNKKNAGDNKEGTSTLIRKPRFSHKYVQNIYQRKGFWVILMMTKRKTCPLIKHARLDSVTRDLNAEQREKISISFLLPRILKLSG